MTEEALRRLLDLLAKLAADAEQQFGLRLNELRADLADIRALLDK